MRDILSEQKGKWRLASKFEKEREEAQIHRIFVKEAFTAIKKNLIFSVYI